MLDLYHATRDELIRRLLDQQEQLAARDRQLARQERELAELRQAVAALTARVGELTALLAGDDAPSPLLTEITAAIRASPVVHLDETGWREAGRNGYVWTASTPEERLFRHGTRPKAMVATLLGETFSGVVVSDFYAAYTGDERVHQYCWAAGMLRDIHELVARQPADPVVAGWADRVGDLFARAQAGAGEPRARWAVRRALQTEGPQRTLCVRILTHLPSLFTCVTEPAVPATNTAAERGLRHLVVTRKISGGTRSPPGTATRMTLASLFGTWRAQGRNPYRESVTLLASPQV